MRQFLTDTLKAAILATFAEAAVIAAFLICLGIWL